MEIGVLLKKFDFFFFLYLHRSDGTDMVLILVVVVFRKAESSSHDIGQRVELYWDVVGIRQTVGRTDSHEHALERIFHLYARLRDHSRQFLSIVELLPSRTISGVVPSLFQLWSVCGLYLHVYLLLFNLKIFIHKIFNAF